MFLENRFLPLFYGLLCLSLNGSSTVKASGPQPEATVIRREPNMVNAWPIHIAGVGYFAGNSASGFEIGNRCLLTAAHNSISGSPWGTLPIFGQSRTVTPSQFEIPIIRKVNHPAFVKGSSTSGYFDVAVVWTGEAYFDRLSSNKIGPATFKPMTMLEVPDPSINMQDQYGRMLLSISGYGWSSPFVRDYGTSRLGNLPVDSVATTDVTVGGVLYTGKLITLRRDNPATDPGGCDGDSGGPLSTTWGNSILFNGDPARAAYGVYRSINNNNCALATENRVTGFSASTLQWINDTVSAFCTPQLSLRLDFYPNNDPNSGMIRVTRSNGTPLLECPGNCSASNLTSDVNLLAVDSTEYVFDHWESIEGDSCLCAATAQSARNRACSIPKTFTNYKVAVPSSIERAACRGVFRAKVL